jgi:predicted ABC-type ATPase
LEINGKNLLIYGENGSGKSTIYWAIYTLLESSFKVNEFDVEKYFKKGGEFGLVNIHATKTKPPFIKMVLNDDAGNNPKEYEVNPNLHQIVANMKIHPSEKAGWPVTLLIYRYFFACIMSSTPKIMTCSAGLRMRYFRTS